MMTWGPTRATETAKIMVAETLHTITRRLRQLPPSMAPNGPNFKRAHVPYDDKPIFFADRTWWSISHLNNRKRGPKISSPRRITRTSTPDESWLVSFHFNFLFL